MKAAPLALLALVAIDLAACGGGGQQQATNSTEQLDEAAAQSDPAAAQAIEDAAANGANPQEALQAGGNAQAETLPPQTQPTPGAGKVGAKPHAPGDPVPPPKTQSTPQQGSPTSG
nr:hypothetical protein [uncultured Sphingosinicella sp.]